MNGLRLAHSAIIGILIVSGLPMGANAIPIVFEASGPDPSSIQATVDVFRAALGDPNNGNAPGPLPSGRREINWDGGGSLATAIAGTPFTGFLNTRGDLFTTSGTGFVQAPPSGLATNFSQPTYSAFKTFSEFRLFSPTGSTLTNVAFFVPGTNGGLPATITGFGAVFSDVDSSPNAALSFVDTGGVSRGTFFVPAANGGLSFLGVTFPGERIRQVQIISGNVPLGPPESGAIDIIPMDDFFHSELNPVPEPTTLLLFGTTAAGLGVARWRQHRRKKQP